MDFQRGKQKKNLTVMSMKVIHLPNIEFRQKLITKKLWELIQNHRELGRNFI